jgi:hypothetical protein
MDFWTFSNVQKLENMTFWKLDVSGLTSGQKQIFLRGPTDKVSSLLHLRTETDPVSETLRFLFSRTPDDGKSPKTQ